MDDQLIKRLRNCYGVPNGELHAEAAAAIESLIARWSDQDALQKRLMELMLANPPTAAMEKVIEAINVYSALEKKTPKELVDLALDHFKDLESTEELLLHELCTRVHPGWENDGA